MNENIQSKLSGLRGLNKSGRELTSSDIRLLLEGIFDNGLGDGVSDVMGLGLDSNLFYGVNVLGSGLLGDKTIRLPNPPIKGRVVKIINNTGYVIYVRPSVVGGSINGVVDGSAGVPSDGKIYEFVCWENPLPGAWSWTPPATGQYDSGLILFDTTLETGVFSAMDNVVKGEGVGFNVSSGWAYQPLSSLVVKSGLSGSDYYVAFRPGINWNSITRMKVYSNIRAAEAANCQFLLQFSRRKTYYVKNTTTVKNSDAGSTGSFFNYQGLDAAVGGVASGLLSANVGDAGTGYKVIDLSSLSAPDQTFVGVKNIGDITSGGVLCDNLLCQMISFQFQTNFIASGIQLRFFLETN